MEYIHQTLQMGMTYQDDVLQTSMTTLAFAVYELFVLV